MLFTVLANYNTNMTSISIIAKNITSHMAHIAISSASKVEQDNLSIKSKMFRQISTRNLMEKLQMNCSKLISVELNPGNALDYEKLKEMHPTLCSITWHYKIKDYHQNIDVGSIPSLRLAGQLKRQGFEVILHIATRNLNTANAISILEHVKGIGVTNLFIVQGDSFHHLIENDKECDFPYAVNFVRFVRAKYGSYFSIGVAAYPENISEESTSILKSKISAGADYIITQANLDFNQFKLFLSNCQKHEINVPIVPGIYIFHNYARLEKFCTLCNIRIPQELQNKLTNQGNCKQTEKQVCYSFCTKLFIDLLSLNNCVHIFTLNSIKSINLLVESMLKEIKA